MGHGVMNNSHMYKIYNESLISAMGEKERKKGTYGRGAHRS